MTKFIAKTSYDIAEDVVFQWLSFMRVAPNKNPTVLAQYMIFYKFQRLGMSLKISEQKTQHVIQGFVADCRGMDIYHPDVSENLLQRISSVITQ